MKDYKTTLNLPKTNFSMKGNLSKKEPFILKKWNDNNIYSLIKKQNIGKKKFFLNDGPPYANGNIHIGHAINKILKDIVIKFKTLSGFDTYYTPSWDCHGLPIEHKVEKTIKKENILITKKEFRIKCRNYAQSQVNNQKLEFIRLGVFGDWENSYLTMNFKNEANIARTLMKMFKYGYVYQDFKPVHWCINCKSALAEAEVEYHNKLSNSIIIKFKLAHNINFWNQIFKNDHNQDIHLVVWTTTPWTLPASQAIALNPNFKYQLIQTNNNLFIISEKSVPDTMNKMGIQKWKKIHIFLGKNISNLKVIHPFLNTTIPVILADHVTQELGTGIVHTAPEFGQDDYYACKKNNINFTPTIDKKGHFLNNIHPKLNNINIFKSIKIVIKLLNNNNALLHSEKLVHSYPYCWRHKTPIISRATQQWFININHNNLRNRCIKYIQEVKWIPHWSKNRMIEMIINRPDWCISRQRTWGVPIPIFIHRKTGKLHPDTIKLSQKIIQNIETNGIQAWFDITEKSFLGELFKQYKKVTDVIDVWFESGSIQLSNIYNKIQHQHNNISDLYIEGLDQHRGWFMSSLIISAAISNQTPYKKVITHGFVVDKNKKKMSKSIGNTVHPSEVINTLGSDILRLWTASTNYSKEMSISQETLIHISDYYRRIRNTARFLLANLHEFNPENDLINAKNMIILDKWAIGKALHIQKKIIKSYKNYNFHDVIKYLMNFCSLDMGTFYLEIIKDRQYTTQKNSIARRSCQTAMYLILTAFVKWITPILPFTSDELWEYIPGTNKNKFVFLELWSNQLFDLNHKDTMNHEYWNQLLIIKTEVNKALEHARQNKIIRKSLEAHMTLYVNETIKCNLKLLNKELKFLFITSKVEIKNFYEAPKDAFQSETITNFKTIIKKMNGIKCPRCWHIITKIKNNKNHEICKRCILNTIGPGELRQFL
ncbi:isoleucyl-tRNA synthetase [Buchnera aphidicola str. Bp (Baizongia pistaciae)]|uniref:Isoleucine--tRNA ligase n=1 Tax=Buchnera aphidicola subsp. Baizongia pistaciae (strain Bp) TaxID=224915 RepID=SYI_BUCBP|nr:isoleucine--tRNA ligase [Buchnera aphidicola]Q89AU9.1 RecName: Full=Isoleucine--tRNA ligase; AltName: Full=Isoleucyl-tRNA synthetase; Short=IleRS [Buchnera aphidicola str. Bp (Baizongia pistaciae)]AAO26873.1 isoleucyl-tRNA synthetase [Buchnera aphidicola str. Bp (Baizongia pistaciae)]